MEGAAGSKPEVETGDAGRPARAIVVAAAPVVGAEALERMHAELDKTDAAVYVVAPALTDSALEHAMGSVDDAIAAARGRLDQSLESLRGAGIEADGDVGDADPVLAIEDALREYDAPLIVIVSAADDDDAHWLEEDIFERARQRFEPPIVHVAVEGTDGDGGVVDVERQGHGAEPPPDAEVEGDSKNMPRFSARDLLGIAVAIFGTIAAILIAVSCDNGETIQRTTSESGEGSSGSCVAAWIVAGLTALINVAHVVGLMLFESVGYRGGWARFFGYLSLVGTPLAVIATLLLAH